MKRVRKAVIPVAGLGTRFLPETKSIPKEMLPIIDKPVIQYIVEEAVASGIEQVILVTSQSKRAIEDHFDYSFELSRRLQDQGKIQLLREVENITKLAEFVYVRQQEPLGNGHAVLVARGVVGEEPFAVLWGDDMVVSDVPCLKQQIEVYDRHQRSVLATMRVPREMAPMYAMIDAKPLEERVYQVAGLVEKPSVEASPSDLAVVKGYVLTPEIFEELERTPAGKGREIWLSDAISSLIARQEVFALEFEGDRYDVGDKLGFLQANLELGLKRPDLREGILDIVRRYTPKGLHSHPARLVS